MPQTLSVLHKLKKIVPIIYQYLCSKHWNKYLGHESTRGTSTTNRRLDVDENQMWAWFGHEVGFCDAVSIPWVSSLLPLPHGVKKQTYKKKYLDIKSIWIYSFRFLVNDHCLWQRSSLSNKPPPPYRLVYTFVTQAYSRRVWANWQAYRTSWALRPHRRPSRHMPRGR